MYIKEIQLSLKHVKDVQLLIIKTILNTIFYLTLTDFLRSKLYLSSPSLTFTC